MKKITLLLSFSVCCFFQTAAQNPGCDGSRYKNDGFATVKMTTVQYATAANALGFQENLFMDVYEPEGDNLSKRPVVILAHGGTFILGNKSNMKPWCELLARKGYVAVSIQYRLYPFLVLGYPDSIAIFDAAVRAMGDMKAAVRHLRQDAATTNQFRADADNIFVGGYSAGAVAALHVGFLDSNDPLPAFLQTTLANNGGLNGNSGSAANQTYSSSVKAVVNMSGGLYRSLWVDSLDIPVVSIHGTADGTVPYTSGLAANIAYLEGSSLIHQRAEAAGLLHNLHTVPGGGHTNIYDQAQFKPHLDTFWVNTTTMLEYLACQSSVSAGDVASLAENWSVFPNPVSGAAFTVSLPEPVKRVAVSLTDMSGRVVFQKQNIQNQELLRTNGLSAGVYFVRVSDMDDPTRQFALKKLVFEKE